MRIKIRIIHCGLGESPQALLRGGFVSQPKVIDAASKLLGEIFGENGRHARSAIGVAELPRGAAVEIEMIVAIRTQATR